MTEKPSLYVHRVGERLAPESMSAVRFWLKVSRLKSGCWIWTAKKNKCGYGNFRVGSQMKLAHRVSWELSCGPIPNGLCVCHRCDTPACVNPGHLFLGTIAENAADRDAKGRRIAPKGSDHGRAKLTEDDIREIRRIGSDPSISQGMIGQMFGVGQTTVSKIIRRAGWSHVT